MNDSLIFFANRIKMLRKKRGLTLEKLSEIVDVSPNHISKLESARTNPSFPLIVKLAQALQVEIKDLFDFEDDKDSALIKKEFLDMVKYTDAKYLKALYNIHKELIYM